MAMNDAELRFRASLDDEATPKIDQLEKKLKEAGATPQEIKMMLKAHDEASPKIKEAKRQIDNLPKEHLISIRGFADHALSAIDKVKMKAKEPIEVKVNFIDNMKEMTDKMFNFRSKVSLPSGVPGANMLYGLGAAGAGFGAATGALGVVKQGIDVNAQMEQSMVTLQQTLKDNTKAQQEMGKVVGIALKTPFQYQDVLQADVRLRSYQIPTMQGEGGPGNKGWLKSAGDMASALNTPITQAVEAIADARQGYFVRMMSYGIRMMREDFQAGGKYAGLTYEQGLERALRRFEGAQEMQSKTFQGVMSNMKDIVQQDIIKPLGAGPFKILEEQANKLQQRFVGQDASGNLTKEAAENQQKLGKEIQKTQRFFVDMYQTVQKGKQYFTANLQQPLTEILKSVGMVGKAFGQAFGGTMFDVVKTLGGVLLGVAKPLSSLVSHNTGLVQMFATLKALSILGFDQPLKGLQQMASLNPFNWIRGMHNALSGGVKIGIALLVKGFLDAKAASSELRNSMNHLKKSDAFDDINAKVARMARGLGQSATHMKELVAHAAQSMPAGTSPEVAVRQGQLAAGFARQYGVPSDKINELLSQFMKGGPYTARREDETAQGLVALKRAADELKISFKEAAQSVARFSKDAAPIGLGGIKGAPYVASLSASASRMHLTPAQVSSGVTTGDALLESMMQTYGQPDVDTLRQLQKHGGIGQFYRFKGMTSPRQVPDSHIRGELRTIMDNNSTQQGNEASQRKNQDFLSSMAPGIALPNYLDPKRGESRVNFGAIGQNPMALFDQWSKGAAALSNLNKEITQTNEQLNKYNNQANVIQLGQNAVNIKTMELQHSFVGLQRQIEDAQLVMAQYQLSAIRPLEREMTGLNNQTAILQHNMQNAQFELGKFNEGLLDGEQQALDNLHALERYNKQLNLLQLSYSNIGTQLGQQVYERGFSTRVQPLFGLSLEMQQEQLQRRQQQKQLQYELTFGEGHYQMQQAARTQFQRAEMPLQERLKGIKENTSAIDRYTLKQQDLQQSEFDLSQKMYKANQVLADQQDNLTALQNTLTDRTLHGGMRGLQDDQYNLEHAAALVNNKIQAQNILLGELQAKSDDLKDKQKGLGDWFKSLLDFGGGNPADEVNRMISAMEKSGRISAQQANAFRKDIDKVIGVAGPGAHVKKPETHQDWMSIIIGGIKGGFTGETWRTLGDQIKAANIPIVSALAGSSVLQAGLTAATWASAIGGVGFLGTNVGRRIGNRALEREAPWAMRGLRGGAGAASTGLEYAATSRFAPDRLTAALAPRIERLGKLADDGYFFVAQGKDFFKQLFEAMRPILRLRSWIGGGIGSGIGGAIGGLFGGPVGGVVGSIAGGAGGAAVGRAVPFRRLLTTPAMATGRFALNRLMGREIEGPIDRIVSRIKNIADHAPTARVSEQFGKGFESVKNALGPESRFGKFIEKLKSEKGIFDLGEFTRTSESLGRFGSVISKVASKIPVLDVAVGTLIGALTKGDIWHKISTGTRAVDPTNLLAQGLNLIPGVKLPGGISDIAFGEQTGFGSKQAKKMMENWKKAFENAGSDPGLNPEQVIRAKIHAIVKDMQDPRLAELPADVAKKARDALQKALVQEYQGLNQLTQQHKGYAKGLKDIQDGINHNNKRLTERGYREVAHATGFGLDHVRQVAKEKGKHVSDEGGNVGKHYAQNLKKELDRQARILNLHNYVKQALSPQGALGSAKNTLEDIFHGITGTGHREEKSPLDHKLKKIEDSARTHIDKMNMMFNTFNKDRDKKDMSWWDDNHKKIDKWHNKIEGSQDTHGQTVTKIINDRSSDQFHKYDSGWANINQTTGTWIGRVETQVRKIDNDLGITIDSKGNTHAPDAPKKAAGGLVDGKRIGRGHQVVVGEEGYPEIIVPLAPHRRDRAANLIKQAQAHIGHTAMQAGHKYAMGGMIAPRMAGMDTAYNTARSAYNSAAQHEFATGGMAVPAWRPGWPRRKGLTAHPHFDHDNQLGKITKRLKQFAAGGYVSPFPKGQPFTEGRVDMGWDFENMPAHGEYLAIGKSKVLSGADSFPGVIIKLLEGNHAGRNIFHGHTYQSYVRAGQMVEAGQKLGKFGHTSAGFDDGPGHIEIGWANSAGTNTAASPHYSEGDQTAEGKDFKNFLTAILGNRVPGTGGFGGGTFAIPAKLKKLLDHPPYAQLLKHHAVGRRVARVLSAKHKAWQKRIQKLGDAHAGGSGSGAEQAEPGGWFKVGATIDPTQGQAPTYSAHGGMSFAELLVAGANAGMASNSIGHVLGLAGKGGYGMPMGGALWARMPGSSKMFKMWKNDVGSGQPGDSHFKIDLHQAIANALGWHPNQDIEVKKAAAGIFNVNRDKMLTEVHRGEAVLNPAHASDFRAQAAKRKPKAGTKDWFNEWLEKWKKYVDQIDETQKSIKRSEKKLGEIKDATDKKNEAQHLRDLNDALRKLWANQAATERARQSGLSKVIRSSGDLSGGEDTLAGVAAERRIYLATMAAIMKLPDAIRRQERVVALDEKTVRRLAPAPIKRAIDTAKRLTRRAAAVRKAATSRRSPGGRRITAAERRKITRSAATARRARARASKAIAREVRRHPKSRFARAVRKLDTDKRKLAQLKRGSAGAAAVKVIIAEDNLKKLQAALHGRRPTRAQKKRITAAKRKVTAAKTNLRRVGQSQYLKGAAKRGVNPALIKDITGFVPSKKQVEMMHRIQTQQLAENRRIAGKTGQTATYTRSTSSNIHSLRTELKGANKTIANHLAKIAAKNMSVDVEIHASGGAKVTAATKPGARRRK